MTPADQPPSDLSSRDPDSPLDWPRERWTLVDALRHQARRLGDRPFLRFEGGEDLTFGQLDASSDAVAAHLATLGVGRSDRVLALGHNSAAFIVTMFATWKRRATFTPINTELKGVFLDHQVRNSEPVVVLVDADLLPLFDTIEPAGVGVRHTIVVGPDLPPVLPAPLAGSTAHRWDDVLVAATDAAEATDQAPTVEPDGPQPSDICTIMYTSGTTGPSKGVLLPQAHCFLFGKGAAEATWLTEDDHYYTCMPFFHANALFMQVASCLVVGASATVVRRFSVSNWLDDCIRSGATVTNALGVMPEFIFRTPPSPHDRDHRLTRIMALPVGEEWADAFEERFGVRIVQGFGMTEVNMVAYTRPSDPVMAGCAGYVLDDHFEVVIADPETDEPLPPGAIGEILVRPRHAFCFNQGYFRMDDKTVEAWRNLWFHTGDAGRFDDAGRLFYVDRLRDRIRRRGENVSSYEIEQVLNSHPAVLESAAVGVKVAGAGGEEEIKACIALEPGAVLDPVALLEFCRDRMPRYAVPRFVEVVDALDKTPSGKIRKQAMRDSGVNDRTWDRESVGFVLPR